MECSEHKWRGRMLPHTQPHNSRCWVWRARHEEHRGMLMSQKRFAVLLGVGFNSRTTTYICWRSVSCALIKGDH